MHGCARVRQGERGFTLVEILVVLIILVILAAIALPNVRTASDGPANPTTALAGGTVWRAIQLHRLEDGGILPPTAAVAGRGAGLVDAAGRPRVRPWPETGRGEPITVVAGAGARPPAVGRPNTLAYAANGAQATTGWLAGYGPRGTLVFRRVIAAGALTNADAPAG